MKKSLCTLFMLWGFLFAFQAINAQTNLLKGSAMETADQASWKVAGFSSEAISATWGYGENTPAQGEGNALRVTISNSASTNQYLLYQALTLEAGKAYIFDAAVKCLGKNASWLEIYAGTVDPETPDMTDYTPENCGGVRVANYFAWDGDNTTDGTFATTGNEKPVEFIPETSGTYYVAIKFGANEGGNFDLTIDNISFTEQVMPVANFTASARLGYTPLTVTFTSTSVRAEGYEWNFGDGSTSAEANPTHTYTATGKYSVSLKVTNQYGENTKTETDFIVAEVPQPLTGGGVLQGGNMEDATKWQTSFLTTAAGSEPVATWNYTGENRPTVGQGGALRVQITSVAGVGVQYAIYQKVNLRADRLYRFNAAFRDNSSEGIWHFYSELYIGKDEPTAGNDYGENAETGISPIIASIGNWDQVTGPNRRLDGSYQANGSGPKDYIPAEDGEYYFVFKMGTWDGNPNFVIDVILDEMSFTEILPKPYTNFSSDINSGFPPLTVQFQNQTKFADSYAWDFGDGSTSTEANPSHEYSAIGAYTVSLKATNAGGDSTIVKTGYVNVTTPEELPAGEKLYGRMMENGGYWQRTGLSGDQGKIILTWNYTENQPTGGEGGNLRVQITPHTHAASANIAIWQAINVKQGYVYDFDGLFKDIGAASDNFWVQVFMSTEKPSETAGDIYTDVNAMARFHAWSTGTNSGKLYDGSFRNGAFASPEYTNTGSEFCSYYHQTADTTLYFILKVGCNGNNVGNVDFLFDNFTLKESVWVPKPVANFLVSQRPTETDHAPFTAKFIDSSSNATKWEWDFGDGSPVQVIEGEEYGDTEHEYTKDGWYSVKLTVYNQQRKDSIIVKDAIQLGKNGIADLNAPEQIIRTTEGKIDVVSEENLGKVEIYNLNGQTVQSISVPSNRFTSKALPQGTYIIKAGTRVHKVIIK